MRRIEDAERRARLVRRHLLDPAARASSVADVARGLVAIHSTDPVTVFLSIAARSELAPAQIERELYELRTVVRMLGMRRTLFVVARELRPVVQAACSDEIAARERRRLAGWLKDPEALAEAETAALDALSRRDEAATAELTREHELLGRKVEVGTGRWAVEQSIGARVLPLLAAEGRLLRTRPRGTWIASQYRWSLAERWLGEQQERPTAADARTELVRRWLARHGPGTEADLRWWTGLGARPVREALACVEAVEVALEDGTGYVLPGDVEPEEPATPAAAFLPALDSTTMGWKERGWYLGAHAALLFDANGNAGPTIWWEGRVVGGWAQRLDGEIAVRLLEDPGREAHEAIARDAGRLRSWLGDVRVRARFGTPLERELAA